MLPKFLTVCLLVLLPMVLAVDVSVDVNVNAPAHHHGNSAHRLHKRVYEPYQFTPEELQSEAGIMSAEADSGVADDDEDGPAAAAPQAELEAACKSHNSVTDCWVILNGQVMDITNFEHPFADGLAHIARACSFDVSKTLHSKHRDEYDVTLKGFIINHKTGKFLTDQSKNVLSKAGIDARSAMMDQLHAHKLQKWKELGLKERIAKMSKMELQSWKMTLDKKLPPKK